MTPLDHARAAVEESERAFDSIGGMTAEVTIGRRKPIGFSEVYDALNADIKEKRCELEKLERAALLGAAVSRPNPPFRIL